MGMAMAHMMASAHMMAALPLTLPSTLSIHLAPSVPLIAWQAWLMITPTLALPDGPSPLRLPASAAA